MSLRTQFVLSVIACAKLVTENQQQENDIALLLFIICMFLLGPLHTCVCACKFIHTHTRALPDIAAKIEMVLTSLQKYRAHCYTQLNRGRSIERPHEFLIKAEIRVDIFVQEVF